MLDYAQIQIFHAVTTYGRYQGSPGCLLLIFILHNVIRAGTNTPSDEYDTYRDTGWRIRYVSRIHFFSEAKLGNG